MLTKSILAMVFMVLQLVQSSTSANMRERSHWKKPLCSPPYPRPRTTTLLSRVRNERYGDDQVHEAGLKVYTTLNMDVQKAANSAVIDGLAAYDRRHGWRVRLQNVK